MDRDGIGRRCRYTQAQQYRCISKKREFKGWVWAIAEIDPALLSDEIERANIKLPKRVLARLDAKAKQHGDTRSGFIAHLAIQA